MHDWMICVLIKERGKALSPANPVIVAKEPVVGYAVAVAWACAARYALRFASTASWMSLLVSWIFS